MAKQRENRQRRKARRAAERTLNAADFVSVPNPLPSTVRPPRQENVHAEADQGHGTEKNPHNAAPNPSKLSQFPLPSTPTPTNATETGNKKYTAIQRLKDGLEVIGLVAGITGVVFLILQWLEMVDATKATREAIEVNRQQVALVQRQLTLGDQAWIGVEKVSVSAYSAERRGVKIHTKNSGHSPAEMQGIDYSVLIVDRLSKTTNIIETIHYDTHFFESPDVGIPLEISSRKPISDEVFEMVIRQSTEIHFHFGISYVDTFKQERHTDSCAIISGPEAMMSEGATIGSCGWGRMD